MLFRYFTVSCYQESFLATQDPSQTKDLEILIYYVVLKHCKTNFDPSLFDRKFGIASFHEAGDICPEFDGLLSKNHQRKNGKRSLIPFWSQNQLIPCLSIISHSSAGALCVLRSGTRTKGWLRNRLRTFYDSWLVPE